MWNAFEADSGATADNEFKPNVCDGNCYKYPDGFGGIRTNGDGTFGNNCHWYSDDSCANEMGSSGNQVEALVELVDNSKQQKAFSVRCFFKC